MSNRKRLLFLTLLFLLAACSADDGTAPFIRDNYDIVTATPVATVPAGPTTIPLREDASGIGRAFYTAWEQGDYLGMYSLLSEQSQALVDPQSFVVRYEETMTTATTLALDIQLLGLLQEGDSAQLDARVTWQTAVVGTFTRDYTTTLAYENGRWGVVWDEGLILPELSGGNQLAMEYRIPSRANIYDINGRAFAFQGTIFSLGVIPGQIEDEAAMLAALSPVLGLSPAEIKEIYAPALPDWYWPIGDVPEEVLQIHNAALTPFYGKGLATPEPRLTRLYPEIPAAPHIVGYTGFVPAEQADTYLALGYRGDEIVGLAGLEAWGEDYLNGERGGELYVIGPNGEYLVTIQERGAKQSRSLYSTLEIDFQLAVEQALAEAILTHPTAQRGSVVVLDVQSGAVLAMASFPTYNPNIFDPLRPNAAVELGQVLSNANNPLLNRAAQGAYPAGSIFKIVTFTAAVNSGLYTPNTLYSSTGTWSRLGENFIKRDWREGGHGNISLKQAIVVSCNSCFYNAAYELDAFNPDFFSATARQFGLGEPTGIVGINETGGTVPSPDWKINVRGEGWVRGDAVNMGIGQGDVQVTPLQIANIFAAIANGGTLYRPTLIDRIGAGGGAPEEPFPAQINGELPLSADLLAVLRESLWKVANDNAGTATHRFVDLPFQVAGKTGTAEAPPNNSHAWFGGYAPAAPYTTQDGRTVNDPEIAVVVMIENAGEGSEVAAPIFRRIVELYYGVKPVWPFPW